MTDFTWRKFLSLPLKQQHKKCAECVRHIYECRIQNQPWQSEWTMYQQLLQWMQESFVPNENFKLLADCYHYHLQRAQQSHQEHHLLPSVRTQDRQLGEAYWPIAIYLDHIRSAHNVGSIIRTVEAFRLGELYFSEMTPFVDHPQVKNAAMQADQWVTCYCNQTLNDLPSPLIALETVEGAQSIYDFIFPTQFSLAIGNEEYGCSENVLKQATYFIEIPLRGRKNSLNVANAFAIVAGEISRQKTIKNHSSNLLKE